MHQTSATIYKGQKKLNKQRKGSNDGFKAQGKRKKSSMSCNI